TTDPRGGAGGVGAAAGFSPSGQRGADGFPSPGVAPGGAGGEGGASILTCGSQSAPGFDGRPGVAGTPGVNGSIIVPVRLSGRQGGPGYGGSGTGGPAGSGAGGGGGGGAVGSPPSCNPGDWLNAGGGGGGGSGGRAGLAGSGGEGGGASIAVVIL